MTFGLKLRETPLYGTKRYVETRVDGVAKKKCSNPNLFEKNISSRLSRKPFSIFLLENTNNKNFPNCNSPVLMILMTRPLILRQEHFLLHSKVFLQPGIFFWGARTRHDLLKLVFCNGLIFFCAARTKSP